MNNMFEEYNVEQILQMYWLRPETIVWTAVASKLVGEQLKGNINIAELGIGNGYFTFLTLGGRFKFEYDWYYNVDLETEQTQDIYDALKVNDIKKYIEKIPDTRLSLAIDHKSNLLKQAKQLNFIDKTMVADGNLPFKIGNNINVLFSNILYWLNDPLSALKTIDRQLNENSKLVLVFPNKKYKINTKSHQLKNNLQILLNQGREANMHWSMGLDEFESLISKNTSFKITKFQTYVSELTSSFYDVGTRPLSKPLIKMANKLNIKDRLEIKKEWIDTIRPYVHELLKEEIADGPIIGGFNFVVLEK